MSRGSYRRERPRLFVLIAAIALGGMAVVLNDSGSLAQPAGGDKAKGDKDDKGDESASGAPTAKKFDHAAHAKRSYKGTEKKVVTDENCSSCHGDNPKGILATPAKSGHQPCMNAGCHVEWFVSVGPGTRKRDPVRFQKAVEFCLGCHSDAKGEPPPQYKKAKADAVYKDNTAPGYHVDFPHYDHTKKAKCTKCHVINKRNYALELNTPGHAECASCHNEANSEGAEAMSQCATCHSEPGPKEYYSNRGKGSETRSCGSAGHEELAAKLEKPLDDVPCFKHERKEHRERKDGEELQCSQCHVMISDRRQWGANRFHTVQEIRSAQIIDNNRDRGHKACGDSRGCHKRDVDDSRGSADCRLCHSQKTIDNDLFSP